MTAAVPTKRDLQRQRTRDRLYEAALGEFRAHGYAAGQIDRIVAAAEVARGTFYFHFPSKEHVLLELQGRAEERIVRRLARGGAPKTVKSFVKRVSKAIVAEYEAMDSPDLVGELLSLYLRVDVDYDNEPLVVALTGYFAQAAERGEVRKDVAPQSLALMFLATMFGFFRGPTMHKRAFAGFIDVFLRGIEP